MTVHIQKFLRIKKIQTEYRIGIRLVLISLHNFSYNKRSSIMVLRYQTTLYTYVATHTKKGNLVGLFQKTVSTI